ncbi:MAG TPA: tRNA lysidine(34) synthetase TilS [Nannocystis exedens]|nr:tRNA lysidine(34) synthetase TilS [Nannocystis exedens]
MPPRHPSIGRALGELSRTLFQGSGAGFGAAAEDPWIRGHRVLVACSGGADSLALLGLLGLSRRSWGIELAVAHVDHGLREESPSEAAMVAAIAADMGLPMFSRRLELQPGAGLPDRARRARRLALREMAEDSGSSFIALGHTATDQLETVLMHLLRGAGIDGLAGMPAVEVPWLRPLLELTREQTAGLCQRLGFVAVDDPTNHDPRHLRVEIREAILPRLRRRNPAIERSIGALARQAADADKALAVWSTAEEVARRLPSEQGRLRWRSDGLGALPRAIRTRVLRQIALRGGADRQALSERLIMAIDRALMAREAALGSHSAALRPRSWDLRPQVRLGLDRGGLWVQLSRSLQNH